MLCMYVCVCIYVYLVAQYNEKKVDINGERLREENSETVTKAIPGEAE